jgi:hypothetical protein
MAVVRYGRRLPPGKSCKGYANRRESLRLQGRGVATRWVSSLRTSKLSQLCDKTEQRSDGHRASFFRGAAHLPQQQAIVALPPMSRN